MWILYSVFKTEKMTKIKNSTKSVARTYRSVWFCNLKKWIQIRNLNHCFGTLGSISPKLNEFVQHLMLLSANQIYRKGRDPSSFQPFSNFAVIGCVIWMLINVRPPLPRQKSCVALLFVFQIFSLCIRSSSGLILIFIFCNYFHNSKLFTFRDLFAVQCQEVPNEYCCIEVWCTSTAFSNQAINISNKRGILWNGTNFSVHCEAKMLIFFEFISIQPCFVKYFGPFHDIDAFKFSAFSFKILKRWLCLKWN